MELDKTLKNFMKGFFGYGDLEAPIWFIGMEEGGGNSLEEINKRLSAWKKLGETITMDMYEFHKEINDLKCFSGSSIARLQPTWAKLIRFILSHENQVINTSSVRDFQITRLGRSESKTCLLELMPLPSPSINKWIYSEITNIPELRNRQIYKEQVAPRRISKLKKLINGHNVEKVVFYGKTYTHYWKQFLMNENLWKETEHYLHAYENKIQYCILPHPTAHGVTNKFYEQIYV